MGIRWKARKLSGSARAYTGGCKASAVAAAADGLGNGSWRNFNGLRLLFATKSLHSAPAPRSATAGRACRADAHAAGASRRWRRRSGDFGLQQVGAAGVRWHHLGVVPPDGRVMRRGSGLNWLIMDDRYTNYPINATNIKPTRGWWLIRGRFRQDRSQRRCRARCMPLCVGQSRPVAPRSWVPIPKASKFSRGESGRGTEGRGEAYTHRPND